MGKCRERTKRFVKGVWKMVSPQVMASGGALVMALKRGVFDIMTGAQKREAVADALKELAEAEGRRLDGYAARVVTEYLWKNLVDDGVQLEELTDPEIGAIGVEPAD